MTHGETQPSSHRVQPQCPVKKSKYQSVNNMARFLFYRCRELMASRRRTQLNIAEIIFGLVGVGFMMLVMFCFVPGGGGTRVLSGLVQLALLSIGAVIILALLFLICRRFVPSLSLRGLLTRSNGAESATATATTAGTYERQNAFLTAAERSFFGVLQQSVATNYLIFPKVRLADIVKPAKHQSRSSWQ
jgi:hypothetical protein